MSYPNTLQQDKVKVAFSNIPSLVQDKVETKIYDEYIRSVVLPDMTCEFVNQNFKNTSTKSPNSRANDVLTDITFEFFATEDLLNYYHIYSYIKQLKYAKLNQDVSSVRFNTIKSIDLFILNNQNESIAKYKFTEAFPITVGQLSFDMGSSDDVVFPVSFMYEESKFYKKGEF